MVSAPLPDSSSIEHCHHHPEFRWAELAQVIKVPPPQHARTHSLQGPGVWPLLVSPASSGKARCPIGHALRSCPFSSSSSSPSACPPWGLPPVLSLQVTPHIYLSGVMSTSVTQRRRTLPTLKLTNTWTCAHSGVPAVTLISRYCLPSFRGTC